MESYLKKCSLRIAVGVSAIRLSIGVLLVSAFASDALAKRRGSVAIQALAEESYEAGRMEEGNLQPESYLLLKGRYFDGNVRDKSVGEVSFDDLAYNLRDELAKRGYHHATDLESNDLLIVVHWGLTELDSEDHTSLEGFSLDEEEGDRTVREQLFEEDYHRGQAIGQDTDIATLIGYDRALDNVNMPSDEHALLVELREERYFIVLMAYDWSLLVEERKPIMVWSTRISIDRLGTNFHDAYRAMTRSASAYFGTNLENLARVKAELKSGSATIGDLEVVEVMEEEE